MTKEEKDNLSIELWSIDKEIEDLQKIQCRTISIFIKKHSYFKKGEQIKIKYPNPISPNDELEIIKIEWGLNYLKEWDIIYCCKVIQRTKKDERKKNERIIKLDHSTVIRSKFEIIHPVI